MFRDPSYYKVREMACIFICEKLRYRWLGCAGHERSLTQIRYNKEGDLLFSCSKDHIINVWFSHNGERLGTYNGHNGTVWTIDVDCACHYFFPNSPSRSHRLVRIFLLNVSLKL
jgi:WD40 repeat protein